MYRRIAAITGSGGPVIAAGLVGDSSAADRVFAPFEVACLDIQGKAAGRPVADQAARRDLRDVRPWPVHALQLAPRHQPGRDGAPGRRHPNLSYACDTHWPWKTQDVIKGEPLTFEAGAVQVPDGPGLGVELDRDALAALHEQYLRCGIRSRDDTGYMRRVDPGYQRLQPRW